MEVMMVSRCKTQNQCTICCDIPANLTYYKGQPFHCYVCKKRFNIQENVNNHVQGKRLRFSFGICKTLYLQKYYSVQPTKQQAKSRKKPQPYYPCPDHRCSFTAKTKSQFVIHLVFHSRQKTFRCALCSKKFETLDELEMHLVMHTGEKAYKCPVCPEGFPTLERVKDHLRCEHLGEKVHICGRCGEEFGYEEGLLNHKKTCKK